MLGARNFEEERQKKLQFDAEKHHQYFRMLINLLIAIALNEIKSSDPRNRP